MILRKNLVSIIMPAYNAERFIEDSIKSVISQSYTEWELIVIDDGSTDSTQEIVQEYIDKDPRIILIHTLINGGVAEARNTGFKKASGRFIAFLDSDDTWESDKLSIQVNSMIANDSHFSFTSYSVMDETGSSKGLIVNVPKSMSYEYLLRGSKIGCLTVMIDTSKVSKLSMKNIGHEDFVLWLEILKEYGPGNGISENLANYRVFNSSLSSNKMTAMRWQWDIYRKIENINVIKSSYLMIRYALNSFSKYSKKD